MQPVLGDLLPQLATAVPGPASIASVERLASSECPALTARRARRGEQSGAPQDPIVWHEAGGANVVDLDGNRYVDLSAGFGAAAIGHSHPRVVAAVQAQAGKLLHALGDLQPSDVKVRLLARLAQLAPWPDARVMLGSSGSDAVEAALKTALLVTGKPGVVAFEGGYHGLSHAPLAVCGYNAAFRAPFAAQLNRHVAFAAYPAAGDDVAHAIAGVSRALDSVDAGAVIVEPVLGRGGVIVPPTGFLAALATLCRARGALLIADEIMTGLGRAGARYRSVADGVSADLVCLGKALGGGMPISACLGPLPLMRAWGDPGHEALHTATFFGHPLAAAAALETLDVIEADKLAIRANELGSWLMRELLALQSRQPELVDVRGAGLLIGIELSSGARALAVGRQLLARGYITVPAASDARVISLTPPLTITMTQLAGFVGALASCLEQGS